jgi:putative ABC transport system permease protein
VNTKLQIANMLGALRRNRLRSVLALIAVALAIGSMMIALALSAGAEHELSMLTERMGKNLFVVKAGQLQVPVGRGQGWYTSTRLTLRDVADLRAQVEEVSAVAPVVERSLRAKFGNKDLVTNVRGVSPGFIALRNFQVESGRPFDDTDCKSRSRVAVVGSFVASRLNAGSGLVGQTIWVNGVHFDVVGQLRSKGLSDDGTNEDDQILVPLQTALTRLYNVDYLSRVLVQTRDQSGMAFAQDRTRALLRENHNLDQQTKDDFEILTLIRTSEVKRINSAFVRGMSGIFAAITLGIGAAGVFAVTYLNVRDRISEVGLRMAIGARRRDILFLFVAEACCLGVFGGALGLLIGWAAVAALARFTQWQIFIDPGSIVIPFVISLLLGLLFSVGPAIRASRLSPVAALRAR